MELYEENLFIFFLCEVPQFIFLRPNFRQPLILSLRNQHCAAVLNYINMNAQIIKQWCPQNIDCQVAWLFKYLTAILNSLKQRLQNPCAFFVVVENSSISRKQLIISVNDTFQPIFFPNKPILIYTIPALHNVECYCSYIKNKQTKNDSLKCV